MKYKKIMTLNESKIISFLKSKFQHIGDDAAILPLSKHENYVVSKDLLVEDVHFRLKYHKAAALAHKALHVNLSDIAAMGAVPKYVLLGVALPKNFDKTYLDQFTKKFAAACKMARVELVGGDTNRSPDKLFISVTIIGVGAKKSIKLRSTARVGDGIFVAGNLGYAHLGFIALEHDKAGFTIFKNSFLTPIARIIESYWLSRQSSVTAMMDLSDGLYQDLNKLCAASAKGAQIMVPLKCTEAFKKSCRALRLNPESVQLGGGEDYGLLFTVKMDSFDRIEKEFLKRFGYKLQFLGRITKDQGGVFLKGTEGLLTKPTKLPTFSHF